MAVFFRILLLCLLLVPPAHAATVALVLSEAGGPYAEFSNNYREAIEGTSWKIVAQGTIDALASAPARPDLIVAVGSNALRQVLAQGGNTPVLATLLPRQSYDKLIAENAVRGRRVSAIVLDQPAGRLAAFVRHLLPGKKRVGMLTSNETQGATQQLRQPLTSLGLTLDVEESDTEQTLLPAINSLLPRVNLLLAIPDTTIYRRENIKAILVTSYRYQRPVIAFSASFVTAGALAALYSTPAQIGRQAADVTLGFSGTLPPPMMPSQFAIAINTNVAQALDLNLQDEAAIRRSMLADKEGK